MKQPLRKIFKERLSVLFYIERSNISYTGNGSHWSIEYDAGISTIIDPYRFLYELDNHRYLNVRVCDCAEINRRLLSTRALRTGLWSTGEGHRTEEYSPTCVLLYVNESVSFNDIADDTYETFVKNADIINTLASSFSGVNSELRKVILLNFDLLNVNLSCEVVYDVGYVYITLRNSIYYVIVYIMSYFNYLSIQICLKKYINIYLTFLI